MSQMKTLTSINKSTYDDSYYGQITPDSLRELVAALDSNQVSLNKNGNIALKCYVNKPEGGGSSYFSVKWMPPRDAAPAFAPAAPVAEVVFEDLPF
tara:strand:- start:836 stop:1123 length:288 start_codon:yes stop_codon:yes gene_type:complete